MNQEEKNEVKNKIQEEKVLQAKSGFGMLVLSLLLLAAGVAGFGFGIYQIDQGGNLSGGILLFAGTVLVIVGGILCCGLKVLNPKEAIVLALFGNYYGTLKKEGFFWVNPFVTAINPVFKISADGKGTNRKVSLKTMTLDNKKQKVNDQMGNPVEIGAVAIWRVVNPTKAVINVENYKEYLSIQCDSIIRNTARKYPYDVTDGGDEKTLRGSSQEIADIMCAELQEKVKNAGIQIQEVRITHLAYAPEIASAMLQRQQAAALIDARQKNVEGAVGMVEMALEKLSENEIVELDEERKAAMVSNLLVVLCGNKDAQPIVNSGSLY